MIFALVRHGQTLWNTEHRLQGRGDSPLTAAGREQVAGAGRHLAELGGWEVLVSSPSGRAQETAAIVGDALGLPLSETDGGVMERAYGEAEGLTPDEVAARWPSAVEIGRNAEGPVAHVAETGVPGSESRVDTAERGARALDQLAQKYAGRTVVVTTHGTFIRETVSALTGIRLDHIQNGGIAILDHRTDGDLLLSDEQYRAWRNAHSHTER